MDKNELLDKCINFSIKVNKLRKYLRETQHEYNNSDQIQRSGTSIGANLAEAECAISRNDFASKVYIALKECSETGFWLELLYKTGYIDQKAYKSINADCQELMRMLSASTITLKKGKKTVGED